MSSPLRFAFCSSQDEPSQSPGASRAEPGQTKDRVWARAKPRKAGWPKARAIKASRNELSLSQRSSPNPSRTELGRAETEMEYCRADPSRDQTSRAETSWAKADRPWTIDGVHKWPMDCRGISHRISSNLHVCLLWLFLGFALILLISTKSKDFIDFLHFLRFLKISVDVLWLLLVSKIFKVCGVIFCDFR